MEIRGIFQCSDSNGHLNHAVSEARRASQEAEADDKNNVITSQVS